MCSAVLRGLWERRYLLFANFLHPVTVVVVLPLFLGGALLGLLVG
jgi:multidrug efflux pump subunit AcrB